MSELSWFQKRIKAGEGMTFHIRKTGIPGTKVIEAINDEFPAPIGYVAFRHAAKDVIEVLDSNVFDLCRRLGVRTYLHEMLLHSWPDTKKIITGRGTESGAAWMMSVGFVEVETGWEWSAGKYGVHDFTDGGGI